MIGMVFLCTFSAVLTLCREVISDYTAYSSAQVEAAAFVEQNTSPTSRFLTNNRHVNEIAALAGRNVLNGAGTFWQCTVSITQNITKISGQFMRLPLFLQI